MGRSLSIHFTSCIALELNTTLFTIINPILTVIALSEGLLSLGLYSALFWLQLLFLCRCATRLVLENRKTELKFYLCRIISLS
jgi:hypothetical protein